MCLPEETFDSKRLKKPMRMCAVRFFSSFKFGIIDYRNCIWVNHFFEVSLYFAPVGEKLWGKVGLCGEKCVTLKATLYI